MDSFHEYLISNHKEDLTAILTDLDTTNNYSLNIDFINLFEADPSLGDDILCNSKSALLKCNTILIKAQNTLIEDLQHRTEDKITVKNNINARFFGLPVCPELHRTIVPKNKDLNCFLKLTGTAVRLTQAKMLEYRRNYRCSRCNHTQTVEGEYEQRYVIKAPLKCNNPNMNCRSTNFAQVHDIVRENCKDYQEMKIQEQVNKLTIGGIPGSIWVTLEDDLVDCCKPGDDVNVCGTVLRRWCPTVSNKKCEVELVIKANHVEVCNAQKSITVSIAPDVRSDFESFWKQYENCPMRGRDVILASMCPKVFGMYMVKLALTLTAITGCSHSLDANKIISNKSTDSPKAREHSVRGQCHLLLVGDPGTGKSQLLKAGALLTPRAVLTSGCGSTKAGLTCTALREDGEWQLEAGALVLADGGVCCIDELAQMREHDRASIHEAMEQQTISVAKAGMICKLNTRCAVIAACNPKGNYDTEQHLSVNVSLGTPLLSRFDLIFILLDTQINAWDKLVSNYIIFGKDSGCFCPENWTIEKLQCYLSLIGPFNVKMTNAATTILQAYYVAQRRSTNRDPSRTTVRMLDSLVRLCQAHARLMFRTTVCIMDAITAVSLMDLSMQDCTLTGTSDALQSTFSEHPDLLYMKIAKNTLMNLNLSDLWQDELLYFARLLKVDKGQLDHDVDNDIVRLFHHSQERNSNSKGLVNNVVESAYFRNNITTESNENDVNTDKENRAVNFFNEEDEDLDNMLNLDDENVNNSNKATAKLTHTADLLAKSLKKHSLLNTNPKMQHIGIISKHTKRKPSAKTTTKKQLNNAKAQHSKDIQSKPSTSKASKRKSNYPAGNSNKKKKQNIDDREIIIASDRDNETGTSSGEDFNEKTMLDCVPSVNDVFDGLKINFSISDSDSDTSNSSTKNEITVLHASTSVSESKCHPIITRTPDRSKPPEVSKSVMKLKQFSFVPREKEPINDDRSILNTSIGENNKIEEGNNKANESEVTVSHDPEDSSNLCNKLRSSPSFCDSIKSAKSSTGSQFRTSIFETDDFSDLELEL